MEVTKELIEPLKSYGDYGVSDSNIEILD